VIARALAAAAALAGLAAAPARAAESITLVDPTTALTAEPPFAPPATGGEREDDAPAVNQRVDSREVVTTGIDGAGRPVAVTVEQRLHVTGTGDYVYTVPAPVLAVAAAPGSQSQPGQRAGAILWAGFSDRRRTLAARARLRPAAAARLLPLQLSLRVTVGGRLLAPGERRSGPLALALTLRDVTAAPAPSAAGRGDVPALVRALDAARRGVFPFGGVRIPLHSAPAARTTRIEAPLAIRGEIEFPAGRFAGPPARFALRLGDGGPLSRTFRLRGRAVDLAAPRVRVVAETVSPRRSIAPPSGRPRWREAARTGVRLDPRRLLDVAEDGYLREARARQYDAFLANPGPPGGESSARYVFVTAPAVKRAAPRDAGGLGTLGVILVVAAAVLAAGVAVVAWAHS
jgi:hypothetical protein